MADHLHLRLQHFTCLSAEDREALSLFTQAPVRDVRARRDIVREGEHPRFVHLMLDGWAIRHKMLEDGRRQITGFLIPGDLCDLNMFVLKEMDHSIGALTPVTVAQIPREVVEELYRTNSRLAQALTQDLLVQSAIQREWIVNLGQRSAIERISHLICELFARLAAVGLCVDRTCHIPITQTDLSEATGVTPVHVNRTLQELRAQGVIEWKGREIRVPDMDALKRLAMFNDAYLHLGREGAQLDSNDLARAASESSNH